jgi:hypothetical protein
MGQYARHWDDRGKATLAKTQKDVRRLQAHTSNIDSGWPLAMLPGVVASTTSGVMVYVNGEMTAMGPLPYLASYSPTDGDNVLLAPMGVQQTYVVIGVLTYPEISGG